MTHKDLSRADEQRLLNAVDNARGLMDGGADPNDAIIKAAADAQLRPHFVQLMVNAVNTGLTNHTRLDASGDPIKAAQEFAVADPVIIMDRLFPDKIKTAAQHYNESVVSAEYTNQAANERLWREKAAKMKDGASMEKAAAQLLTAPKAPQLPGDPDAPIKKALATEARCKQATENARREVWKLRDKVNAKVASLSDYFRTPGCLDEKEVQANAVILYGSEVEPLMGAVKQGMVKEGYTLKVAHTPHGAVDHDKVPYRTIRECLQLKTAYAACVDTYHKTAAVGEKEAAEALRPFVLHPILVGSVLDGGPSLLEKLGAETPKPAQPQPGLFDRIRTFGRDMEANDASSIFGKEPSDDKLLAQLMDPGHEAELRSIQSQAMMAKLLSGPFAKHDPQDVMDAYNRVSPFIPEGAQHEALAQDLIGKQLSGGDQALDLFTLDQAGKVNSQLRDMRKPINAPPPEQKPATR